MVNDITLSNRIIAAEFNYMDIKACLKANGNV